MNAVQEQDNSPCVVPVVKEETMPYDDSPVKHNISNITNNTRCCNKEVSGHVTIEKQDLCWNEDDRNKTVIMENMASGSQVSGEFRSVDRIKREADNPEFVHMDLDRVDGKDSAMTTMKSEDPLAVLGIKLDLKSGFYQIRLAQGCQRLQRKEVLFNSSSHGPLFKPIRNAESGHLHLGPPLYDASRLLHYVPGRLADR